MDGELRGLSRAIKVYIYAVAVMLILVGGTITAVCLSLLLAAQ